MANSIGRGTAAGALALGCCLALALGRADTTVAQTGSRQTAEATFVEQRPGVPTALTFRVDYVNPDDPDGKPPAVRTVVETLAQGAHFDTSVPERCAASDAQLMLQGESACPPGSKVGTGYIRIDTGFPEPNRFIEVDVVFLNNADQLIFLSTDRDTGARVVARATIQGGRLTSSAPPLPGTPPDGGTIDVVQTQLDSISRNVGGETRGYITTPPQCPPSRAWVNSLSFTYADGVTQSVESPSPCLEGVGGHEPQRCANTWEGSRRSDRHAGTPQGDRLLGFRGADRLRGRGGGDCLHGHPGSDVLRGGAGADTLIGGPGGDRCHGGRGDDRLRGCERIKSR
jgi:RTX calcium-binding nonapeptide repeat (4 copies)